MSSGEKKRKKGALIIISPQNREKRGKGSQKTKGEDRDVIHFHLNGGERKKEGKVNRLPRSNSHKKKKGTTLHRTLLRMNG